MNDDPRDYNTDLKAQGRPERLSQLSYERDRSQGTLYTRFVRISRLLFPLAALGIIAVVLSWPQMEDVAPPQIMSAEKAKSIGLNELINPRFESQDDASQPYVVTADSAVQSPQNPEVVMLTAPKADIALTDGTKIGLLSENGTYRQAEEVLLLEGDVQMFHNEGYHVRTPRMTINIKGRQVWSDQNVEGEGPAGTIKASGFRAEAGGETLIFTGPATLVLHQSVKGL